MGCFVQGGRNGMGCFVRGGKNGMGCFVRGDKNCMGCFVRGGKSMRDVLSGVTKNGMGCFVPGCFVLHSIFYNSSYTSVFFFIGACFFNQRSCLRYFNASFSPANLTAYVANVNPALTPHVLDDIKICFLKVR